MDELILDQYRRTRKGLAQALEGASPETISTIPSGFNNSIHWQVGHILVVTERFFFNDKGNLPANYKELFGPGSKPAEWPEDVPSVETLLEQLNEQLNRIKEYPSEKLEQKLPKRFLGCETVGQLIATGAFHEAMHLGQIQSIRRVVENH